MGYVKRPNNSEVLNRKNSRNKHFEITEEDISKEISKLMDGLNVKYNNKDYQGPALIRNTLLAMGVSRTVTDFSALDRANTLFQQAVKELLGSEPVQGLIDSEAFKGVLSRSTENPHAKNSELCVSQLDDLIKTKYSSAEDPIGSFRDALIQKMQELSGERQ